MWYIGSSFLQRCKYVHIFVCIFDKSLTLFILFCKYNITCLIFVWSVTLLVHIYIISIHENLYMCFFSFAILHIMCISEKCGNFYYENILIINKRMTYYNEWGRMPIKHKKVNSRNVLYTYIYIFNVYKGFE